MSDVKSSCLFWILCGVITAAVCLVYYPALSAGFYLDDWREIVRNPVIQDWKNPSELWYYYKPRFLTYFSFALNFAADGLDPAGYHAVNIGLHIVSSLLVFGLVRSLLMLSSGVCLSSSGLTGGSIDRKLPATRTEAGPPPG